MNLFVYGTLMRSAAGASLGGAERQRLWAESRLVGPATLRGRLYDFGAYPGVVLAPDDPTAMVHGEVLEIADPARTFQWLDRYEMIEPGDEAQAEYARVVAVARLAGGGEVQTLVYVTRRDVAGLTPVAGGRWM
jgi:gamma-glutamylcyclotransferase (GGCT)/AIG2-like uncharacterized protein YtfP